MLTTDGVVGPGDRVLDVAEQGVDPVELRIRHAGTSTPGDVAFMDTGGGVKGSETPEAVTNDLAPGRNRLLGIATYLGKGKATHTAKLNTLRMAVVIGLHGSHKRELVISAAPALSRPLAAQIGVIDLDASGEPLSLVALVHDLQQLVFELPGRVVADAELPGQLQRREAILALGQQVDGQEPGGQRQVGGMEDGAGGERGLMMTAMTLVDAPRESAGGGVTTVGADEPSGPTMLVESRPALFLCAVLVEKRRQ